MQRQTYTNWELCICDDGSDAATHSVLSKLAQSDRRIRVTALGANNGIAIATNAALQLASGEFVAFLDHDDELDPDALSNACGC